MRDGPLFLVNCQQVYASPDSDRACEVAGHHSVAGRVELDEHNGVLVWFALLFGRLGILIPNSDAA